MKCISNQLEILFFFSSHQWSHFGMTHAASFSRIFITIQDHKQKHANNEVNSQHAVNICRIFKSFEEGNIHEIISVLYSQLFPLNDVLEHF